MFEFHCNQQRHDHAEDCLKDCVIERVQRVRNQQCRNRTDQLPKRHENNDGDHQAQHMRDKLFEAFIKAEDVPLQTQCVEIPAQPVFLSVHDWVPGWPPIRRAHTAGCGLHMLRAKVS